MKHLFSRSFFAVLCAAFACTQAFAIDLNPFAFKLSEKLEGDIFTVTYYLNAPANNVKVIIEVDGKEVVYDCTNAKNTIGTTKVKGIYHVPISLRKELNNNSTSFFRDKTNLPWRVEVIGGNTASMPASGSKLTGLLAKEYAFWASSSIDIDTDPMSQNFGLIYCTETRTLPPGKVADGTYYTQYLNGSQWIARPGLYVFDPAFQNMPPSDSKYDFVTPNNDRNFARSYDCTLSTTWGTGEHQYFAGTTRAKAPHRVRLSDDGRLFISCWTTNGVILKELKAARLSYNYRKADGTLNNNWVTNVFNGNIDGSDNDHNPFSSNLGHVLHILETSDNKFIAAPNIALDVRGSDENLTIFAASGDKGCAQSFYRESFYFNEYNLGTATSWNTTPTKSNFFQAKRKVGTATTYTTYSNCIGFRGATEGKPDSNGDLQPEGTPMSLVASYDAVNFEYDQYGGIWMCQYRANQNENASLYHINSKGNKDYEEYVTDRSRGAIRYNKDFKKLAVAGGAKAYKTIDLVSSQKNYNYHDHQINGSKITLPYAEESYATVYDVTHTSSTSAPQLKNPVYVYLGQKSEDFAWDYAGNLYAVSANSEKVSAYALPNGGKPVATPCKDTSYIENTYKDKLTVKFIPSTIKAGTASDNAYPDQMDRHNETLASFNFYYRLSAKFRLLGQAETGFRFFQWDNETIGETVSPEYTMKSGGVTHTAKFAMDIRETTAPAKLSIDVDFPGIYLQRELDNESYSTICLPFDLYSLDGTPYAGASIKRFAGVQEVTTNGVKQYHLLFENVAFNATDYMEAGVPYLIKVTNNIAAGKDGEKIFKDVKCPCLTGTNIYGGYDVETDGFVFRGMINPTTFPASKRNLFMTADNRLATLYQESNVYGLRGFFSIPDGVDPNTIKIRNISNAPTEVSTPVMNSTKPTKYLWNGRIYIQRGGTTYDISGHCIK